MAVITFIICTANLVSSLIDSQDPLHSGYQKENLSSFETFKLESMKSLQNDQVYIPTDEELRSMYEATKNNTIQIALLKIHRNLVVNSVIILIGLILFAVHWRLMKKYEVES